jgi:hypothetical protein
MAPDVSQGIGDVGDGLRSGGMAMTFDATLKDLGRECPRGLRAREATMSRGTGILPVNLDANQGQDGPATPRSHRV